MLLFRAISLLVYIVDHAVADLIYHPYILLIPVTVDADHHNYWQSITQQGHAEAKQVYIEYILYRL